MDLVTMCYNSRLYEYVCPAMVKTFYFYSDLPTDFVTMLTYLTNFSGPQDLRLKLKSFDLRGLLIVLAVNNNNYTVKK